MASTSLPSRERLRALFDKALAVGGHTHTRQDVAAGIVSGRFQYWGDDACCLVTEIVEYPRTRKLHIFLAAGCLDAILGAQLPKIVAFAREQGCSAVTTIGRKGFLRKIVSHGFTPKSVAFEMKVEGTHHV